MSILMRAKSSIYGLNSTLQQLATDISTEQLARQNADGDLTTLETTEKSNLVVAINEVLATANQGATDALKIAANLSDLDDVAVARTNLEVLSATEVTDAITTASDDLQDTINTLDEATVKKAANLSDLDDVAVARTNLEVLSATEVAGAIEAAKLALGTKFTVDTLAERDAMVDLDDGDRVLVRDGDGVENSGNWVLFKPREIVDGVPGSWMTLSSKLSFEATSSAEAIKTAYESNADTNAFTDAEQSKLAGVEAGAQVNTVDTVNGQTGTVVLDADHIARGASDVAADLTALEGRATSLETDKADITYVDDEIATAKEYADEAARTGGVEAKFETVSVVGSTITLSHAPKGGLAGVMNFTTVRYIDGNGVAYDAPLIATAVPEVFTVSTDTADQWDGNDVMVQYLYVPAA